MNLDMADKIVAAVLYEGYILYPYRASAVKNRQRFTFGTLYPRAFSELQNGTDAWTMRSECLVEPHTGTTRQRVSPVSPPISTTKPSFYEHPRLEIRVRFLHPVARQVRRVPMSASCQLTDGQTASLSPRDFEPVASLAVGDELFHTWQEVFERDVMLELDMHSRSFASSTFPATEQVEQLHQPNGQLAGVIVRRQREIQVGVEAVSRAIGDRLFKVTVNVHNHTPLTRAEDISREDVLLQSLASTHIIMSAPGGEFVSLLEPPEEYADAAESCKNEGCWPVLVGEAGQRNLLLASPIILYDYPQVAPESPGDFFDGTEMDEMLALRVMTLTDEEKREMRGVDARARHILERTSSLPQEHLMKLHGKMTPVTVTRPMQARRPSE